MRDTGRRATAMAAMMTALRVVAGLLSACGGPGGTVAAVGVGNVTRNTWRMLRRALVAAGACWLCACANQSDRLHDLATQAMTERSKVDQQASSDSTTASSAMAAGSYAPADQRWSIAYPAGWSLEASARYVKFTKGQAVVGVHSVAHVAGDSLDQVADTAIREWERQMQGVNLVRRVSRHHVTLSGGLTAIAVVHPIGTGRVGQSRKTIAVHRDRRFLIDTETLLASWAAHEGDFNQIIGSFRVLD